MGILGEDILPMGLSQEKSLCRRIEEEVRRRVIKNTRRRLQEVSRRNGGPWNIH